MNRFGSLFKPLMWFMALLLAAFVAGCGGGDDSGPGLVAPIGIVDGAWTINEDAIVSTTPQCTSPQLPTENLPVSFAVSGNALTVTSGANTFSGTISGNTMHWTGSFPDNGGAGTTTINSLSVTVDPDCNTLSAGTMNWTYVEPGGFTCTADTTFHGSEKAVPQTGCGA